VICIFGKIKEKLEALFSCPLQQKRNTDDYFYYYREILRKFAATDLQEVL